MLSCPFVCLYLSACFLSVWLCPFVCLTLSFCLSVPACLFICLALSLSICACLSFHLSGSVLACLSFHLSGSVLVCLCLSGFFHLLGTVLLSVCLSFQFGSVILSVCPLICWSLSVHLAIRPSDWGEGLMAGLITCRTVARAVLPMPTSVGGMFWCPNNDMASTLWDF